MTNLSISPNSSQIAFIDSGVTDYQKLAGSVVSGINVVILDSFQDGIEQITKALSLRKYDAVHIVSHGSPGCIYLGNSQLSLNTLDRYASDLKTWFSLVSQLCPKGLGLRHRGAEGLSSDFRSEACKPLVSFRTPNLLIYGCNVAAGDAGAEFVTKLNSITGAEIAASTTLIGNAAKGGNWNLDYQTEANTNSLVFTEETKQNYAGVLATVENTDAQTVTTATTIFKTFDVVDDLIVNDLTFGFNAGHTWRGNLEVTLQSPSGTIATIIERDFDDNFNNYDVLLQDKVVGNLNSGADEDTAVPIYGADRIANPSNPLSVFDNELSLGQWTIGITNFNNPNITNPTRPLQYNRSQLNITGTSIPSGSVATTGTVYIDYNNNGSQQLSNDAEEIGYEGIVVKAYDASNNLIAQTTTGADGGYTLFTPENTPLRIEYDNIPEGFVNGSIAGTNSVSNVFFIDGQSDTTANFGIVRPSEITAGNGTGIDLVTVCYVEGIGTSGASAIVIHNYNDAGRDPYTPLVNYQQIGSVNGLAHHRESNTLFAGSFYKRHTALLGTIDYINDGNANSFSNDTNGAAYTSIIYSIDDSGNVTEFARLDDEVDPRGAVNSSSSTYWEIDNGEGGTTAEANKIFDSVGKIGLGDVELSEDGQTLWAVNLNDNKLYQLPVGDSTTPLTPSSPNASEINSYDLITQIINDGDNLGVNPQQNIRPFALSTRNGLVYVGMVNTAQYDANGVEGNTTASDLRAFVYAFDPNNPTAAPTQALDIPLNYERDQVIRQNNASEPADWNPWVGTWPSPNIYYTDEVAYPQPILSDIEFDPDGNMILGFRDRFGDQMGNGVQAPNGDNNGGDLYQIDSAGDIIQAVFNDATNSWTIETHVTTDGINGNNDPDGEFFRNEFFEQANTNDSTAVHAETAQGGLALVPGFTEVVTTAMDPVAIFSGGYEWFNTELSENGSFAGHAFGNFSGLEIFGNIAGGLGKANGLGDVEFVAAAATLEIGDRIWFDADNDGIQDVGEDAVPNGVTVELYGGGGTTPLETTTTNNGNYVFTGLSPLTDYEVRLTASDFATDQPLEGYQATLQNVGGNNELDSNATNSDGVPTVFLTTGTSGVNDHSFDIGLTNNATYDYGDAPDATVGTATGNYQTTEADNGARHILGSGLTIGNGVTADNGTLQNVGATADTDDGVTFTETLETTDTSFTVNVDVNLPATTLVASDNFSSENYTGGTGWLGDWTEVGESNGSTLEDINITNGELHLQDDVASIYRQFDFSNASGDATLTFNYSQNSLDSATETFDVIISDSLGGNSTLALRIDNSTPNSTTANQFHTFSIPESFLTSTTTLTIKSSDTSSNLGNGDDIYIDNINITAPGVAPANLVGWIDFDRDGEFSADEAVSQTVTSSGVQTVTWDSNDIPGDIASGSTYARFRLSTDAALNTIDDADSIGELSDGEVEDYQITIGRDYGDAIDPSNGTGTNNYQTRSADNGASHGIIDGLSIGSIVDADSGLLEDANASADDTDGSDDEDGVTFGTTLSATDTSYSVSVDVTNTTGEDALLTGWIDFDQSGTFDNDERVSTVFSSSGTQNLIWDSLPGLVEGTTYARFRLSNDFTPSVSTTSNVFSEDFEGTVTGWSIDPNGTDGADTAAEGQWEFGTPTAYSAGGVQLQPTSFGAGTSLVTEATGDTGGDVDNGLTTVRSPNFVLSSNSGTYDVSFQYYFAHRNVNGGTGNNFTARLVNQTDGTIQNLIDQDLTANVSATELSFDDSYSLASFEGDTVYLEFVAEDSAAGDNVEAGIDNINITFTQETQPLVPLDSTGALDTGEVEDYVVNVSQRDYGDAPDPSANEATGDYQTTADNGGASHLIDSSLKIGSLTDADSGTLQNVDANADNITDANDEDGVIFNSGLDVNTDSYSTTVTVTNETGNAATLVGWVDFNQNGQFESIESVVANVPSIDTNPNADDEQTITLTWDNDDSNNGNSNGDLPGTGALSGVTLATGTTYARFRLTTDTDFDGDNALGAGGIGEVEDYRLSANLDYGDARDTEIGTDTSNYNTTAEDNGASHVIVSNDNQLTIGSSVDADDGTLENSAADADDSNGVNDEDGINTANLATLQTDDDSYSLDIAVTNNIGSNATLIGWIDFDQSGTFDPDEAVSQLVSNGTTTASPITLNWNTPLDITDGITYARFRLSSDFNNITIDSNTPVGNASNGEVEDYVIDIEGVDYGDAPDPSSNPSTGEGNYQTTQDDNGASHVIVGGLKLGATVDADNGTLQNTAADADDVANNNDDDDEDGISFPNTLSADTAGTYTANIDTFTNSTGSNARIIGWIDFDRDGQFEASEASTPINVASEVFDIDNTAITWDLSSFTSGVDIVSGPTYARFRIVSDLSNDLTSFNTSSSTGAFGSGEVEDYQITIEGGSDFGDAADTGTNYDIESTSHSVVNGLSIGSIVDNEISAEALANANATATGDDSSGQDDEDGVTFDATLTNSSTTYSVTVSTTNTTGSNAELIGWIDFDGNGTFDSDEASTPVTVSASGTVNVNWTNIPSGTQVGDTYARFRLNSDPANIDNTNANGTLNSGEVEDYLISVKNEINGTGGSDNLTGTGDGDLIIGGAGRDVLTGGAGDDCFYFRRTSDGIDTITDFDVNGDKLDLSELFETGGELAGVSTNDPVGDGYIEIITAGSAGTLIRVDFDPSDPVQGSANFDPSIHAYSKNVVLLRGVTSGVDASDFIF